MRTSFTIWAVACAVLLCASPALPADVSAVQTSDSVLTSPAPISRADTLWFFDADFEDLLGDNAGWTSEDLSWRPELTNYWHKDTIRINGFEYLGDSTWWCGTYNNCWLQPRGYGNDWTCDLVREVPLGTLTAPGDAITLEWDQRVAIETDYDYGYVDISADGGSSWTTRATFTNPGFQSPGVSQDWDSQASGCEGHQMLDLSAHAGTDVRLRFRFESDAAVSSQDEYDYPPMHACRDGAWQLDNIMMWAVTAEAGSVLIFNDDCESPGDNGWVHEDLPAEGQTGIVFERRFESFGGHSGWMMSAYDTLSGGMVDGQRSRLLSPPMDVSGAPEIVVQWDGWYDLGTSASDFAQLVLDSAEEQECLWYPGISTQLAWYEYVGGPAWIEGEFQTDFHAGSDWLGLIFMLYNRGPTGSGHGTGFALDRVRVGVPIATHVPQSNAIAAGIRRVRPNPFNPSTTVDFAIAAEGRVALHVYDVAGRLVKTLVDGELESGEYEATWDGTDAAGARVASGVYMLRLEAGGHSLASAKAVLLK